MIIFSYFSKLLINFSKKHSRKNLYEYLISAIKKYYRENDKVISIGSGGPIKKTLLEQKIKFKEIDIDRERKPDYVCDIEKMDIFEDDSVDIIFCLEVLEHVRNPFNAIKEIERILKTGGLIIGSVPFVFPIHEEPRDYYRYTKYGLLNLFQNFECVELIERNSYVESIGVILLRLVNIGSRRQRFIGALAFLVYLLLGPFFAILSCLVKNKQSTTGYFFIFKKIKGANL